MVDRYAKNHVIE
jgi:hypothetical protein